MGRAPLCPMQRTGDSKIGLSAHHRQRVELRHSSTLEDVCMKVPPASFLRIIACNFPLWRALQRYVGQLMANHFIPHGRCSRMEHTLTWMPLRLLPVTSHPSTTLAFCPRTGNLVQKNAYNGHTESCGMQPWSSRKQCPMLEFREVPR